MLSSDLSAAWHHCHPVNPASKTSFIRQKRTCPLLSVAYSKEGCLCLCLAQTGKKSILPSEYVEVALEEETPIRWMLHLEDLLSWSNGPLEYRRKLKRSQCHIL
ncbi:uncharacterized protein PV07_02414 [Cladophialophora immunda]|uniref:Uncharacterized protein n=1 Tax=Cladophialophora immunda TaxID=569365 RepID=A0A0D1ZRN1_9EURO|nr:uncharacterized protein PV07_02414 [Cladophialophora immunda]KIW30706.1 hypothetical protein PV07_02414 [Cladophialophora immunda]